MRRFSKFLAAAAIAAVAPMAASATSIQFDLRSHGDVTSNRGHSVTAESGGVSLTISGMAFSGGINGRGWTGDVTAWGNGLGMRSYWGDNHAVDGFYDEYLLLSFSETVDVTSLSFSYADGGDDWTLLAGDFGNATQVAGGALAGYGGGNSVYTAGIDGGAVGTQFLLGTTGNRSEWKARGISVDLAPVPLPASGLLLLAGMGGIAAMRRRNKRS